MARQRYLLRKGDRLRRINRGFLKRQSSTAFWTIDREVFFTYLDLGHSISLFLGWRFKGQFPLPIIHDE
jgi:hypothetical protein